MPRVIVPDHDGDEHDDHHDEDEETDYDGYMSCFTFSVSQMGNGGTGAFNNCAGDG